MLQRRIDRRQAEPALPARHIRPTRSRFPHAGGISLTRRPIAIRPPTLRVVTPIARRRPAQHLPPPAVAGRGVARIRCSRRSPIIPAPVPRFPSLRHGRSRARSGAVRVGGIPHRFAGLKDIPPPRPHSPAVPALRDTPVNPARSCPPAAPCGAPCSGSLGRSPPLDAASSVAGRDGRTEPAGAGCGPKTRSLDARSSAAPGRGRGRGGRLRDPTGDPMTPSAQGHRWGRPGRCNPLRTR